MAYRTALSAFLISLACALPGATASAQDLKPTEVLNWADGAPASLDPHEAASTTDTAMALNLYNMLYRYEGNPPKLVPSLATGFTVSPDGLSWTFTLQEGVKFHSGAELTAEDVVYSFQRVLALKRAPSAAFWPILKPENITAPGRYEVSFVLDKPYAPFQSALPLVAIVEKAIVQSHETDGDWAKPWLASNDAGSGPYMAAPGFRGGERAVIEWYPDYFEGWPEQPIKRVNITTISQETTLGLALIRGEIDASSTRISADTIARMERAAGVRVESNAGMRTFLLTFNNQRAPLDNVHVRRAISYAFDYDGYIDKLRAGTVVRNPGPLPINLWGNPDDLEGYARDIEKAKAEIELAKADGVDLSRMLTVYGFTGTLDTDLAMQLLQSNLREIGLRLEIKTTLFPTLVSMTSKEESSPDMWFHWVSATFVDPENWIGQMYDSQFHGTWKASAWYRNDEVDALLREARTAVDQEKRAELYGAATQILMEDAPAMWVSNAIEYRGIRDRVQGLVYTPVGSGSEFRNMRLVE